ncbi:TIGR02391 family protein [uncultured Ruminococcus sp.]|uniref:TIGR02391 family protein n=1 Tax=uncultured Ruminococcus sp. TaxID=165186 RepID=UPI0026663F1D|nr:TIGR02391 family protein [uncultured Ruminococcus sp.]
MVATEEKLQLRFDPRTIEHLGIKMYSRLPYALAELVANAYDAGAETVDIKLYDNDANDKRIVISDDGDGMSYQEVNENFLIIGRKRRETDEKRENSKGRKITGKKGVGKLALFGIGQTIKIETTRSGEKNKTVFIMDWDEILKESSGAYYPKTEFIEKADLNEKGTIITLSNLSRATNFDVTTTATSLAKLFNWFDVGFNINLSCNDGTPITLTRELIYEGINKEFEWNIEDLVSKINNEYKFKSELRGKIISSKKPIKADLRGITLYVNGRLANVPGFFGVSEAGHTFSYLSGWIDADFLDECDRDLISTDRQSLSWDLPEAEELQMFLQRIVRFLVKDWSSKRKKAKTDSQTTRSGINIPDWYEKVPEHVRPNLTKVIEAVSDKPEVDDEDFSSIVHTVYDLIPPYTYYHYRILHPQIQEAARRHYESKDYYTAFQEAMKRYKNSVKDKSKTTETEDLAIVSKSFGKDGILKATSKFQLRPNGQPFSQDTLNNIENGQQALSRGVVQGGRNIVSHEEHSDLMNTGLFTEMDCLDLLSLLSHLFRRLDEAEKK